MAEPAEKAQKEAPVTDPAAIDRAYRLHRAKRQALKRRERQRRRANIRFWIVMLLLLAGCVYLGLTIWRQVENLFGL
jgi:hypothetical protein